MASILSTKKSLYVIGALFDQTVFTKPWNLTASLGCPLSRLLPPGFYLAIPTLVEQIRARYRRGILLPVCQHSIIVSASKSLISIPAG